MDEFTTREFGHCGSHGGHGPHGPHGARHPQAFGDFGPGMGGRREFGDMFGGPRRGGPWGERHRGRARRGDVRASILALLTEHPMHGYEIIQEISERSAGSWKPSPGSVYPTLQMLEDEGLITSVTEAGKKMFTLTDRGRGEAEKVGTAPWEEAVRGVDLGALQDIRQAAAGLMGAFQQVCRTGTQEQKDAALALVNETRKQLYRILAD